MRHFLLAAVIAVVCAPALRAQPAGLPDSVVGVIEVPKLQALQDHVGEFVTTVSGEKQPIAPVMGMMLMSQTYSTNSGLIEAEKPYRVLLLKAADRHIAPVAVFSVKGPSAFRNSLRGDLKKGEEKEGLTTYTHTVKTFDRKAYQKAKPEEQKDFNRFMISREEKVAVGETESLMCVGKDPDAVRAVMTLATEAKLPEAAFFADCDLGAWINVQALVGHISEDGKFLNEWREGVKELPADKAHAMLGVVLQEYIDGIEMLAAQVATVSGKVTVTATEIRALPQLTARPKTAMAAYLASVPKGTPDTIKYAPDDAAVLFAGKLGDLNPFADWGVALMRRMAALSDKPVDLDAWSARFRQSVANYGDDMMFALTPKLPLAMISATRMKSADAARTEIERMADMMTPVAAMYRKGGIDMKIEDVAPKTEINGSPVWQRNCAISMNMTGNDDVQRAATAAMQKMYGKGLMITSTVSGTDNVNAIGPSGLDQIKSLLAGQAKKIGDTPEFKQMLSAVPANPQTIVYVHVTDIIAMGMDVARDLSAVGGKDGQPVSTIAKVTFARGPGVLLAFRTINAGVAGDLVVPAAEVKCCYDGFAALASGNKAQKAQKAADKAKAAQPAAPAAQPAAPAPAPAKPQPKK